jgi:hypothetical protein
VTRHLNGDPGDNRLANLAYGTPAENAADRRAHGRTFSKLAETDVFAIRAAVAGGEPTGVVASRYGVCPGTVRSIARGGTWRHIGPPICGAGRPDHDLPTPSGGCP